MSTETIVWKGRCGPFELKVARDTFRPSTISTLLAESMDIQEGSVVVDAGCGSGVLSIVAAKLGAGRVYGVDAAAETVEIATANAKAQGVSDRTTFYQGDMFGPIPDGVEADVVIGDVSGIPDDSGDGVGMVPFGAVWWAQWRRVADADARRSEANLEQEGQAPSSHRDPAGRELDPGQSAVAVRVDQAALGAEHPACLRRSPSNPR